MYQKLSIKKVVKKFNFLMSSAFYKSKKKNAKTLTDKTLKREALKFRKETKNLDVLLEPIEILHSFSNKSSPPEIITESSYYGCEKNSKSCLGQIYSEKPFYVYMNRMLPPCCSMKLQSVFKYLIEELESSGVRYW